MIASSSVEPIIVGYYQRPNIKILAKSGEGRFCMKAIMEDLPPEYQWLEPSIMKAWRLP
ncbi:MAG TPA: hypothetical protein HA306_03315 [Methanosarcina sp.]|nr:hypothetical protein [Methanosarcina sp.]